MIHAWADIFNGGVGKRRDTGVIVSQAAKRSTGRPFRARPRTETTLEDVRRPSRTGHPPGGKRFFTKLEKLFGQDVPPRKPGRPAQGEE